MFYLYLKVYTMLLPATSYLNSWKAPEFLQLRNVIQNAMQLLLGIPREVILESFCKYLKTKKSTLKKKNNFKQLMTFPSSLLEY